MDDLDTGGFAMNLARVGEVVWYATGRFYSSAAASGPAMLQDVGYFLHLQGIRGLFSGARSEKTALLTFSAVPFAAHTIENGSLSLGIDERGAFSIFLREAAGPSFDRPASFAEGRCVATFERVAIVPTSEVAVSAATTLLGNVFSARLVSSEPFELGGAQYDFRELVGHGITQWGTAATAPMTPPAGYQSVVPFLGSAIRTG
jgi:hypothetical protein